MTFYLIPAQTETGSKELVACHTCVGESTVLMFEVETPKLDDDDQPIRCQYCPSQGCSRCGDTQEVADYNDGRGEKLMLCDECRSCEAERANEAAQGDAWEGGFAANH